MGKGYASFGACSITTDGKETDSGEYLTCTFAAGRAMGMGLKPFPSRNRPYARHVRERDAMNKRLAKRRKFRRAKRLIRNHQCSSDGVVGANAYRGESVLSARDSINYESSIFDGIHG